MAWWSHMASQILIKINSGNAASHYPTQSWLSIECSRINFNNTLIKVQNFFIKNMHLKIFSVKWCHLFSHQYVFETVSANCKTWKKLVVLVLIWFSLDLWLYCYRALCIVDKGPGLGLQHCIILLWLISNNSRISITSILYTMKVN